MDTQYTTFTFEVTHDDEAHVWLAECATLSIVTEAATYEQLIARVWAIAPEMAQENGFNVLKSQMRLCFEHIELALA